MSKKLNNAAHVAKHVALKSYCNALHSKLASPATQALLSGWVHCAGDAGSARGIELHPFPEAVRHPQAGSHHSHRYLRGELPEALIVRSARASSSALSTRVAALQHGGVQALCC